MTIVYEELVSEVQNLTFREMAQYTTGKTGSAIHLRNTKTPLGKYNNYGLSISDQCPWRIKLSMDGATDTMQGPLPMQAISCIDRIFDDMPSVPMSNRIAPFKRFPKTAIQEAVLNSLIHCDLSSKKDIVVNVEDEMISVTSPGGLYRPMEWNNVCMTSPRNPEMARLLCSLDLATLRNRGTALIKNAYASSGVIPCIIRTDDSFSVRLPPIDTKVRDSEEGYEVILNYLAENGSATLGRMSSDMMVSIYYLKKILSNMEAKGLLFSMGLGMNRRIFPVFLNEGLEEKKLIDIRSSVAHGMLRSTYFDQTSVSA